MSYFVPPYYMPMDRAYHAGMSEETPTPRVEDPIFPISQVGTTVPENDPTQRAKNIVQGIQANIRHGAGTMQVVMQTPPQNAIGGRAKAYGEEVRQAIKEVAAANKVFVKGFEMPTSMNNLSGFDGQNMRFSDETRNLYLNEIKDNIKFAADAAGGGGIDLVSWEYPRQIRGSDIIDQKKFEKPGEERKAWLVDKRTQKLTQIDMDRPVLEPEKDEEGNPKIGPDGRIVMREYGWKDFEKMAKESKTPTKPEAEYIKKHFQAQIDSNRGWAQTYKYQAQNNRKEAEQLKEAMEQIRKETQLSEEKKQKRLSELQKQRDELMEVYKERMQAAASQEAQAQELERQRDSYVPIDDFAFKRSTDGYAKAAVWAYDETHNRTDVKRPIYIGPEIGWPDYFGGHPDEFKKLILDSRKRMIKLVTDPKLTNEEGQYVDKEGNPVNKEKAAENPYYRQSISPADAAQMAERHIKGMFDTSHMGMWLANFKANPGESEKQRLHRFNQWYLDKVKMLADPKDNLIGGIQLVDSASAAHGHLPIGQGIFPVKEAAKIFKDKGFKGYLVSEGHEEEKFGEGRILHKTWAELGSPIGGSYLGMQGGAPFGQIQHSYFGRQYSPLMMVGAYTPSNAEFKLWSEVPFE